MSKPNYQCGFPDWQPSLIAQIAYMNDCIARGDNPLDWTGRPKSDDLKTYNQQLTEQFFQQRAGYFYRRARSCVRVRPNRVKLLSTATNKIHIVKPEIAKLCVNFDAKRYQVIA